MHSLLQCNVVLVIIMADFERGVDVMMNSAERMSFIIEYISAYEAKIALSNKNGLFDTATLFELFAINVCELWFCQKFYNLNEKRSNYPYVDLVSEDNTIYVQVSTVQNVSSKIKSTLEKIKASNDTRFEKLKEVFFFVLNNDSIDQVKDYTGENKIGKIDFEKDKHLITTQDVVARAKNSLNFQTALYELLEKDNTKISELSSKLLAAFHNSKEIGLTNITSLINGEYEIDRTSLINKIKDANKQFISIRGEAGCGKSVICKKLVENEQYLLYARAERFVEESDIDSIWHLCISDVLLYLQNKPITFFIDSLEFIADAPSTKLDLLQSLYELVKGHPNAKIITSCRSSDETSFIKIDSKYAVMPFLVEPLTAEEIHPITKKYPIVQAFLKDNSYSALISIPFYINLIVSNVADYTSISDENALREYIWENVICLRNKAPKHGLSFDKIAQEVTRLTFARAQSFSLGVSKESIEQTALHVLISEGILIENGHGVRLKYDIFEDICFEKEFDNAFISCRGEYGVFFDHIEEFGRCSYRRYQIWIANKILSKENREKFLYNLISTTKIPTHWSQQTIIGLTKSRFCSPFFEEQTDSVISSGRLQEFIDITNLYAFSPEVWGTDAAPGLLLHPIGEGREALIKIIYDQNIYTKSDINKDSIIKLCSDYAKSINKNAYTANIASKVLQYFITNELSSHNISRRDIKETATRLLNPIYQMAEFSKDWIVSFWEQQTEAFLSKDRDKQSVAEDLLEYTLKFTTWQLAKHLPDELCNIADIFWTTSLRNRHFSFGNGLDSKCYHYGLNRHAEDYEHSSQSPDDYRFFPNLIDQNFWKGLYWAIRFINKCISNLATNHPTKIKKVTLMLLDKTEERKLFASRDMWFAGIDEYQFPALLSDIVYLLRIEILRIINGGIYHNIDITEFANNIKATIFQKTNNISMLSIIEDVGCQFEKELPGYALDLATCMEIIFWDIERFSRINPNVISQKLEKQILQIMGIPNLKQRYPKNASINYFLRDYVGKMQFVAGTQQTCHRLLDYLYGLYPNTEEHAQSHLQIQHMDFRSPNIEQIDEKTVAITPSVSGFAKEIVDTRSAILTPEKDIQKIVSDFVSNVNPEDYSEREILPYLEAFQSAMDAAENSFAYTDTFLLLVSYALNKPNLESKRRDTYCNFWVDGIEDIFNNGSFLFDDGLLYVLFKQVDSNASQEVKNRIKRLLLQIIMDRGMNGRINSFRRIAKGFIKATPNIQAAIINTVIALSKDEMQHQLFNYDYAINNTDTQKFDFIPNRTPKLRGVDQMIQEAGKSGYASCKDQIIEKYLYGEDAYKLTEFVADDHDLTTLCSIVDCGINLKEPLYHSIAQSLVRNIVATLNIKDSYDSRVERLDTYTTKIVTDFLGGELFDNLELAISVLFDEIDFTKLSQDAVDFYLNVFGTLLPSYVDAYNNPPRRRQCEAALSAIESKLNSINCADWVQRELYRSLILSVRGFEGDWGKVPTDYSYADIQFLNTMFSKYGKYNFNYFMLTIYKMKFEKLLPYILPAIADTIAEFATNFFNSSHLEDTRWILNYLILLAYLKFSDNIKQDAELTTAYEKTLEVLIDLRFENAAVLLDEFRVH